MRYLASFEHRRSLDVRQERSKSTSNGYDRAIAARITLLGGALASEGGFVGGRCHDAFRLPGGYDSFIHDPAA